jgi:hypothetical protein
MLINKKASIARYLEAYATEEILEKVNDCTKYWQVQGFAAVVGNIKGNPTYAEYLQPGIDRWREANAKNI